MTVHLPVRLLHLHLVLPVGLSFDMVKSMSYAIAVFRAHDAAVRTEIGRLAATNRLLYVDPYPAFRRSMTPSR